MNTLSFWGIIMDTLFLCLLAWCCVSDIKKRSLSNQTVILLLYSGLVHMEYIILWGGVWWQYPTGLLLSMPFFIAWIKKGMGAGDVKLIAAISLYLGFLDTLVAFALMIPILSALFAWSWFRHKTLKYRIPLAPVIGIGAAGTVILGYLLRLSYH